MVSASSWVGSPETVTNIISVLPFLVIWRMLSGLLGSILEKSTLAGGLSCSIRSSGSFSSSSCWCKKQDLDIGWALKPAELWERLQVSRQPRWTFLHRRTPHKDDSPPFLMGIVLIVGSCSGGELSYMVGDVLVGIVLVGSCPSVELSEWRIVLVDVWVGSCPGGEVSEWGVVLVGCCPSGELSEWGVRNYPGGELS